MQSFKQISEDYDTAIKNLKKVKRGSKVSFNHAKTGKKITGTYQGLKRMMGRSYAHVEHPKGSNHPNMIPVHHIHQAGVKKESVDELSMTMKDLTKTGLNKAASPDKDKLKKDLEKLKKGVSEEYPHPMYDPKSGEKVMAKTPADHKKYSKMGYTHDKPKMDEVSSDKLGAYMRKSAADAAKPGASARRQDKRIGGQSMADKKIRKKMGYSSTAKVPAGTNEDDASARMYRDNPDMMKQQGPGGFKSLDPKMKKTIKKAMKKLPAKSTNEGKARDRLAKMVDKASGRTMADREKDAAAATARRKEAEKDLASFRKKNNL